MRSVPSIRKERSAASPGAPPESAGGRLGAASRRTPNGTPTLGCFDSVAFVTTEAATWQRSAALVALALATFSIVTSEVLPVGLLPQMSEDLGSSLSTTGYLVTGYAGVVALTSIPLALATRRVERRRLLCGVLALFSAATALAAAAPGYWVLFVARMLAALAHALFWAVVASTASRLFPAEVRGRVLAVVFAGSSLAFVLGLPAGALLGQQAGWRVAFLTLAAIGAAVLAALAAFLPSLPVTVSNTAVPASLDLRRYGLLVAATILLMTGMNTAATYITVFLDEVSGLSPTGVDLVLFARGLAGLVGVAVSALVLDRWPRATLQVAVATLAVAQLGTFAFGSSALAAAGLITLTGVAGLLMASSLQGAVLDVAPDNPDVASAGSSASFNVGIGGGALIGGLLLDTSGVRSTALVAGLLAGAALAAVLAATRHVPDPLPAD
jgi:DHA1 family inner membrane transport protein